MTPQERHGVLWGALGVASFSLTLPATRAAVAHLDVGFVAIGRGLGAGLLAAVILWTTRQPVPRRSDLFSLCGVAAGVVIGFPFLTTLAMVHVPAAHGAIVVGLLPLSTAVAGVALAGERPSAGFWIVSLAGTAVLLAFILDRAQGSVSAADVALIGAVVSAAFGYALGGRLATRLGGWQVICWALVVSLPFLALAALVLVEWPRASVPWSAWAGFAYVTLVSQLLGFFAWYHGLAIGGIARVSQTQLLQLFMTLAASAVLLGERLDPRMLTYGAAIVAIVAAGTRVRVNRGLHPARESKSRSSP
ncbi:MAG: DMT family transporter [Betaproteobacteria bacterium]|nr:DMT family transporter [Betaproteobacteria bacterium]MBA3776776.1 DMT family transporter [Betaproteobacteria bacterium]